MIDDLTPQPKQLTFIVLLCWALAVFTPLSLAAMAFVYYPAVVENEHVPWYADTLAIPVDSTAIMAILLFLTMMAITWLCVRRTAPASSFFAWRSNQPVRSFLVSVVLVGSSAAILIVCLWDFRRPWPWYEYLTLPTPILFAFWLLGLRGAVLSKKVEAA